MEMNEHNNTALRLEELSKSDFEISDHQPDITGWELVDSSGDELGEIEDLIFDREARKVRYLTVSLELEELDSPRLVLVPIGIVNLDEDNEEVVLPQGAVTGMLTLPVYRPGTVISPAEELAVRYAFMGREGLMLEVSDVYESHPEDFYSHAHFDDKHFTRKNKEI